MNRSRWSIVPVVALSTALFAACGSSSYSGSATVAPTKAAAATTPVAAVTTPAAAATTPAAAATPPPAAAATTAAAGTTAGAAGGSLEIKSFAFVPPEFSAKAGDIAVKNTDSAEHTFTSDDGKTFSVDLAGGASGTLKAIPAGTYKYHCAIHPSMKGTLTVA